jgi:hypothetical protein
MCGMCQSTRVLLPRRQSLLLGLSLLALPRVASAARAGDAGADALARWIAGMAATPGIPAGAEWTAYAHAEDERWQHEAARIAAMQEWSARELAPLLPADRPVFYPFAGPDALHAMALFGGAPRVFLVGLEPVGALPDPARTPPRTFERLGAALADVHRLTFFRTHAMATDFQRDGVLGALVATVARMGGTVTGVETATSPPSARIEWTTPSGLARRLDYVQVDLANAGWKTHAQLVQSVHALAPYVTFVKAASYLVGEPRFSAIRQAILDDSAVLVQDDTGVPFGKLGERWALRLFGRYETPTSPFEDREQPDLRAAFERRARSTLPFGLGYHIDARRSNLLVAVKGP